MSDTDSFIEEVTEEVRRDRLYDLLRRYGWIAILLVLLVVAGTAWQSWRSSQAQARAQALGDAMLSALDQQGDAQIDALSAIESDSTGALALRDFILAATQIEEGDHVAALATLQKVENNAEVPLIYRQIASFKALTATGRVMSESERRTGFEALTQPGNPLRTLAEEQLALIEIAAGTPDVAIERLQLLISDAESTPDLQQRAVQVIVALGAEPDLEGLLGVNN